MALLYPNMAPLEYSHNRCDRTKSTVCKNRQSTTWLAVEGYLHHQQAFILRGYTFTASVVYLTGNNNTLGDDTLRW